MYKWLKNDSRCINDWRMEQVSPLLATQTATMQRSKDKLQHSFKTAQLNKKLIHYKWMTFPISHTVSIPFYIQIINLVGMNCCRITGCSLPKFMRTNIYITPFPQKNCTWSCKMFVLVNDKMNVIFTKNARLFLR